MKPFCLAFLGLLLSASGTRAFGEISEKTLVVTGQGPTAEAARRAALVEAVRQAEGMIVTSEASVDGRIDDSGEASTTTSGDVRKATQVIQKDASFSELTSERIGMTTKGVIAHYKILKEDRDNQGIWTSELEASCPLYTSPLASAEHGALRSIAVEPFALAAHLELQKEGLPVDEAGAILAQAISEPLVHSRKFRVLERAYLQQRESEERFIREKAHIAEVARFGKAVGADYLIAGTIREYWHGWSEQPVAIMNTVERRYSGKLAIEYRLVDTATTEIRMSNTLQLEGGQELLASLGIADADRPFHEMARALGSRVSDEILENVYPVMVMAVSGPFAIYLNQGGGRFRAGDEMVLFGPQKSVRDPATGTEIRVDGREIGRLRINAVRAKSAIGVLESGDINQVQTGCLARLAPLVQPAPTPVETRSGSKFK